MKPSPLRANERRKSSLVGRCHVRGLERVAKSQFVPGCCGCQKSALPLMAVLKRSTPSITLAWCLRPCFHASVLACWERGERESTGYEPLGQGLVTCCQFFASLSESLAHRPPPGLPRCEDQVLDGPTSGRKGSKFRIGLFPPDGPIQDPHTHSSFSSTLALLRWSFAV